MNCPACSGAMSFIESVEEISRSGRLELTYADYVACENCGLVGKTEIPSNRELEKHYSSSWQYTTSRPDICWESAARFISKNWRCAPNGKSLDVGSKGEDLAIALIRKGLSFSRRGLDPHPTSDTITRGWVGAGVSPTHDIDFISATHVLEHSADPLMFVQDILGMLAPRRFAYIEVPSLELHAEDAGSCDDVNRDHLWHFTLSSLMRLVDCAGGSVAAYEMDRIPKWPVHRLLITHNDAFWAPELFHEARRKIHLEYEKAVEVIKASDPTTTGLYAASHSYLYLLNYWPEMKQIPVFDLYREGVLRPDKMQELGIKRVFITSRFWNSQIDIKMWLGEHYPEVEALCPYSGMLRGPQGAS